MILACGVAVAAALGAVARYLVDHAVERRIDRIFPWSTLLINVSGSFVLGLATGLAVHHGLAQSAATVIGAGFAGGYTTWSTYLVESADLAETGSLLLAGVNVLGSLVIGFAAAAAGLALALL